MSVGWKAKVWLSGWMLLPMLLTLHAPVDALRWHLYNSTPDTYTTSGVVGSTFTSLVNAPYSSMVALLVHSSQLVPAALVVRYRPRKVSPLLAMSAYLRSGLLADCFRLMRLVVPPAGRPVVSWVKVGLAARALVLL